MVFSFVCYWQVIKLNLFLTIHPQSPSTPVSATSPSPLKLTSDAQRQKELRERARKLIEEARSGMNKPEVPGIAAMTEDARRRKEEMAARTIGENHAKENDSKTGSEAPKPDLRLKKIMLTRPELAVTMATTAAKLGTNDSEGWLSNLIIGQCNGVSVLLMCNLVNIWGFWEDIQIQSFCPRQNLQFFRGL